MKNYKQFLNENINQLKFSIYDWDDNILMMGTKIHVKKNINGKWVDTMISTKKLVEIKDEYEKYWDNKDYKIDFNNAFIEFRDYGPRGDNAFLDDVKKILDEKKYGPSWDAFIKNLIDGNLFGIVTTRGHEPNSLRKGVEYIIYNSLSDEQQTEMLNNLMKFHDFFNEDFEYLVDDYLNNCIFIGVMSQYFIKKFKYNPTKNPNKGKQDAVYYIINKFSKYGKMKGLTTKIGFSDDDPGYYNAVKNVFVKNKEIFDKINFYVFDTSDHNLTGGKKEKI